MAERDLDEIEWEAELSPAETAIPWPSATASRQDRLRFFLGRCHLWIGASFEREIDARRGFLWLPVGFGAGALVYFALPAEPLAFALLGLTFALVLATFAGRGRNIAFRFCLVVSIIAAGAAWMKLRTDWVATPILAHAATGTLTGFVEAREARIGGYRLAVDLQSFDGRYAGPMPRRVTVTVRGAVAPFVGDAIRVLAQLRPPSGPALPGGYDFRRNAFYAGIGATGFAYGRATTIDLGPPPLAIRLRMPLEQLREAIRTRISAFLPGETGKVATSLIIGDAGGLSEAAQEDMRQSGLAHILSVSGLHMVLVSGVVYWTVRALLALFPTLALRRPIKKWAAVAALLVSAFYLLISGLEVAAQRSFIMTAIVFLAILVDRKALSLRNIAISAWIVLLLAPESILSASFQMSFAATIALVAGFEALGRWNEARRGRRAIPESRLYRGARRAGIFVGLLATTSLLGGLGSTPFALYHFQRMAPLSILANVVASPITDLVVMPACLIAVLLMPFGLDGFVMPIVDVGIRAMLGIAATVSEWSAGSGSAAMPSVAALLLFVFGFLWMALWQERWRWAGIVPMLIGGALALSPARPDILIAADGRQAAIRQADGRLAILAPKPDGFTSDIWLRADGDPRTLATRRAGLIAAQSCDDAGCIATLQGGDIIAWVGDRAAFEEDCRRAVLVITPLLAPEGCAARTAVIDRQSLDRTGAEALFRRTSAQPQRIDGEDRNGPIGAALESAPQPPPIHAANDDDMAPLPDHSGQSADATNPVDRLAAEFDVSPAYPALRRPWMPTLQ